MESNQGSESFTPTALDKAFTQIRDSKLTSLALDVDSTVAWIISDDLLSLLTESKTLQSISLKLEFSSTPVTGSFLERFNRSQLTHLSIWQDDPTNQECTDADIALFKKHFVVKSKLHPTYCRVMRETISSEGLAHICALTNLVSLHLTLTLTPSMKLIHLNKLTCLSDLKLSVYEDFSLLKSDPVWMSGLPASLHSLNLHCEPTYKGFGRRIESLGFQYVEIYRTYAQCLPYIGRLSRLNKLELTLGGLCLSVCRSLSHKHTTPSLPSLSLPFISLSSYSNTSRVHARARNLRFLRGVY